MSKKTLVFLVQSHHLRCLTHADASDDLHIISDRSSGDADDERTRTDQSRFVVVGHRHVEQAFETVALWSEEDSSAKQEYVCHTVSFLVATSPTTTSLSGTSTQISRGIESIERSPNISDVDADVTRFPSIGSSTSENLQSTSPSAPFTSHSRARRAPVTLRRWFWRSIRSTWMSCSHLSTCAKFTQYPSCAHCRTRSTPSATITHSTDVEDNLTDHSSTNSVNSERTTREFRGDVEHFPSDLNISSLSNPIKHPERFVRCWCFFSLADLFAVSSDRIITCLS